MDGFLKVSAYDQSFGRPVGGARVRVLSRDGGGVIEELTTDESGVTAALNLPAPPVDYSMEPGQPQPYSLYDLQIHADGYDDVDISGVQILPDAEALQDVIMFPGETLDREDIAIPPNILNGDYPPKDPEPEIKELPQSSGFVVLPEPVIPEYIVVHAGVPTNPNAANYWVPFKDYIKNAASSEIYSTWPEETLKANVLAIISLTLNRVYTEWYRNKGYDFTITNSTQFDQAFTYGRNIFTEISVVVDDVFENYITKPDIRQPLFTQYCDGKNVHCPGWMTQWGSKALGDQGYSAINILKTYYGWDIYLNQAKQVQGVPSSFGGETLMEGSTGTAVRVIQEQLNGISKNYPAIRKIAADGNFGPGTRQAVEVFQKAFKLPITGAVDRKTWYKISEIFVAVTKLAAGV